MNVILVSMSEIYPASTVHSNSLYLQFRNFPLAFASTPHDRRSEHHWSEPFVVCFVISLHTRTIVEQDNH